VNDERRYTVDVLRNQGVPVRLGTIHAVYPDIPEGLSVEELIARGVEVPPARWELVTDHEGTPLVTDEYVRFTINAMADLETEFDSLTNWQLEMRIRPTSAIRRTFALLFGAQPREMGERMLGEELGTYGAAIGAAWAMANGVDPQTAAEILERATKLVVAAAAVNQVEAEKIMTPFVSPTTSGSPPG